MTSEIQFYFQIVILTESNMAAIILKFSLISASWLLLNIFQQNFAQKLNMMSWK